MGCPLTPTSPISEHAWQFVLTALKMFTPIKLEISFLKIHHKEMSLNREKKRHSLWCYFLRKKLETTQTSNSCEKQCFQNIYSNDAGKIFLVFSSLRPSFSVNLHMKCLRAHCFLNLEMRHAMRLEVVMGRLLPWDPALRGESRQRELHALSCSLSHTRGGSSRVVI